MKTMNVGMLGGGSWARRHLEGWQKSAATTTVAIYNRTESRARKLADEFDIPMVTTDPYEIIGRDDIDIISISMPHHMHAELSNAAVAAGKHVYCEKPLAMSHAEAKDMWQRARDAGVKTGMQFNPRSDPLMGKIKTLIDEGYLGNIRHVEMNLASDFCADPGFPMTWRFSKAIAGTGALGDMGVYVIDSARWLVGEFATVCGHLRTDITERPVIPDQYDFFEVIALARSASAPRTGETAIVDNDDEAVWLARFENGATGQFKASRISGEPRTQLYGSEGTLIRDYQKNRLLGKRLGESKLVEIEVPARDPNETIISQFIRDLQQGTEVGPDYYDGMQDQGVIDAIVRSSEENRWVSLDEFGPAVGGASKS